MADPATLTISLCVFFLALGILEFVLYTRLTKNYNQATQEIKQSKKHFETDELCSLLEGQITDLIY